MLLVHDVLFTINFLVINILKLSLSDDLSMVLHLQKDVIY